MALSSAHTSTKTTDVTKLLLLNNIHLPMQGTLRCLSWPLLTIT